jgi:hypothetical protein
MTLPRPGAPRIDNVIATLLANGNSAHSLDLDRIAAFQQFDPAEFRARFAKIETAFSLNPSNAYETPEGK